MMDKYSETEGLIYLMVESFTMSLILAGTVDWGGIPIA